MKKSTITIRISDLDVLWRDAVRSHGVDAPHEMVVWIMERCLGEIEQQILEVNPLLGSYVSPTEENTQRLLSDEFFYRRFQRLKAVLVDQFRKVEPPKLLEAPRSETTTALVAIKKEKPKKNWKSAFQDLFRWT